MCVWRFEVKEMTVGYDGKPLIKDISITVKSGEIVTLIGSNGAGKSTILKSITGQLQPLAGTVYLEGINTAELSHIQLAKRMSVVLTESKRPELMTVREVVEAGRYPYTGRLGTLLDDDTKAVQDAMEITHIAELSNDDVNTLSDGQRQRVMLARALAQDPEVLVLDEPTSYLDIRHQLDFLSVIKKLSREKGLTVIMSMHDLDLAESISDTVMCVKGEYIEKTGKPSDIFTAEFIGRLYDVSMDELIKLGRWRGR